MSGRKSRSRENRNELIKDLSERLQAGVQTGDMMSMLDDAVPRLARDLAATITQDSQDAAVPDVVKALSVLVAVHWARYRLLPQGQDQYDLQACLKWSAELLPIGPHLVPTPVRAWTWCPSAAGGAPLRPWSRVVRMLANGHAAAARLVDGSPFLAAVAGRAGRVAGVTIRCSRRWPGSSLLRAASTARSAQSGLGRVT